MADVKVRCPGCGKKTTDPLADRCQICGSILPDANRRRAAKLGAATAGPAFTELVESEVEVWRLYADTANRPPKTRRPPELDEAPRPRRLWRRSTQD